MATLTEERLTEIAREIFDKEEPFGLHCQYSCDSGNYEWKHEFDCPDGYEFKDENGNVINATKIVLEKKKPKYPKSYRECLEELDYKTVEEVAHIPNLLSHFERLLVCRDTYWKIAGDWRPEFRFGKKKYCIMTKDNKVISATVEETNRIFTFPTAEMRDAFYENFKDLIEECKELL